MVRWLLLNFIFMLSFQLQAVTFEAAGESICPECSVSVKQLINRLRFPVSSDPDRHRVAIVLAQNQTLRLTERTAINQTAGLLKRAKFGNQLIQKSIESEALSYRLFYQLGIDQNGSTSLNNSVGLPTYEIDKYDPHELWGFFQSINGRGYVFLNEYQRSKNAIFTLVHELMHLFDEKTQLYIERQRLRGEWTELDQMAVEFRALLAEVLIYKQLRNTLKTEFLTGEVPYQKFIDRSGEVNLDLLSQHVLDVFYPSQAAPSLELVADQGEPAFDMTGSWSNGYRKSLWRLPVDFLKDGIFEVLSFFLGESIKRCSADDCPILSGVLLHYKKSGSMNLQTWSEDRRRRVTQQLTSRGASHLLEYLKMNDLTSDLASEVQLRRSGINEYFHSSGGPSPRIGGGTLKPGSEAKVDQILHNTINGHGQKILNINGVKVPRLDQKIELVNPIFEKKIKLPE